MPRLSYVNAFELAHYWIGELAPHCEQIAYAGSVRRLKPEVGDLEILAVPKAGAVQMGLFGDQTAASSALDDKLSDLISKGYILKTAPVGYGGMKAWGPRWKRFYVSATPGRQPQGGIFPVDLFIILPPAQWGSEMVIRTGPGDFSKEIMRFINACTALRQDEGALRRRDGTAIPTPTEREYFEALGLPWVEPERRTTKWLYSEVKARGLCSER